MRPFKSALSRRESTPRPTAETTASAAADACLTRQPIFRSNGDVAGYALLYRRAAAVKTAGNAGRGISAHTVVHAVIDFGLDRLTAGRPAFMSFTREMLLGRAYTLIPPASVVVQLESVEPDDDVQGACEDLVDAGYTLALGDFVCYPRYRGLLELATIVKVDVLGQPATRLDEVAQWLAPYDVRLVAEGVETADVRAMCAGLGYEMFQGYFYARPEIVVNRSLGTDALATVQAMRIIGDEDATDAEAEQRIGADLGLGEKLRRLVSSAAEGRGIESTRHPPQPSGRAELRKWVALLLVSSLVARGGVNRELVQLAVQRGRMCELLAGPTGRDRDSGSLFVLGLFSLLDAISGMSMRELLDAVGLAPALRDALLTRAGPYASVLLLAEAYERGAWGTVAQHAGRSGMDPAQVGAFYLQSLAWTRDRLPSLASA